MTKVLERSLKVTRQGFTHPGTGSTLEDPRPTGALVSG